MVIYWKINHYTDAYNNPSLNGIRGGLRTPNSSNVVATNATPSEAFAALIKWGKKQ